MSKNKVGIRDIARLAGVSVATVSRVLNNKPDVSPETRDRIRKALQEAEFQLSRSAVSLSTGRTGLIALVLGELTALSESVEITRAVAEHSARAGYGTVLWLSNLDVAREFQYANLLAQGSVDGAILYGLADDSPLLDQLQRSGLPTVLIEPKAEYPGLPTVRTGRTGEILTQHLLELGHRRIGVITITEDYVGPNRFLVAYRQALVNAGLPLDPDLVVQHNWLEEMGYAAGQHWGDHLLELPEPPTAIICCNDNVAMGVMDLARARGISIPTQLSVVGQDDIPSAATLIPGLTTIYRRAELLGETAADLLFRRLSDNTEVPAEVIIPTEIVVRGTTAPPPASKPNQR